MRLVYRRDDRGCLRETLVRTPEDTVTLPAHDARAAGEAQERVALVVHPDDERREELHSRLLADGFHVVVTCAGPESVACPALLPRPSAPCPRCLPDVSLILLDQHSAAVGVADRYREWAPGAEIRVVDYAL